MRVLLRSCLFFVFAFSFLTAIHAQIYKWKDKDGNLVVSSTPPPPGVKVEKKNTTEVRPNPEPSRYDSKRPPVQEVELKRSYRDIKVILYKAEWCQYCRKARTYLNSLGVNLIEHDVDVDPAMQQEGIRKAKGKKSIPVIDIEGNIIVGFGEQAIRRAVEEKRNLVARY